MVFTKMQRFTKILPIIWNFPLTTRILLWIHFYWQSFYLGSSKAWKNSFLVLILIVFKIHQQNSIQSGIVWYNSKCIYFVITQCCAVFQELHKDTFFAEFGQWNSSVWTLDGVVADVDTSWIGRCSVVVSLGDCDSSLFGLSV